ncbi:MAG: aminodeoxychorismate/anthranilate synthase component II [Candidatus Heimdallarchaeota archaeon]|nr:aminodeoxychorismate/anthranilate synthase component II [Candidatus Heimdallarchaeota archaeon]
MTILIIDNYDSFTYNLVQQVSSLYLGEVIVYRNDMITIDEINLLSPNAIILSPGPGNPENKRDFGICRDILSQCKTIPILGICLGHQGIGLEYGAVIKKAPRAMHGKTSRISHENKELFKGIENNFNAMRYHSLMISRKDLPKSLEILAESDDGCIMSVKVLNYPTYGIQFHPESYFTEYGDKLLNNFISLL